MNQKPTHLPAVTVVVTVLNEALTIEELLHSLAEQTYPANEIIIVDGGSSDQTVALIEALRVRRPKLPLLVLQQSGNRSVGRNAGIQAAHHELIAITDAGCWPHPNWLEQLVRAYQSAQTESNDKDRPVVVAGYYDAAPRTPFEEAVVPYVLVMPDRVDPEHFLPATRSMLLPKKCWQQVGGFDEQLADNEDYAFAHQLQRVAHITFAAEAKVTWFPRSNLQSFLVMVFRFARGDIRAGLVRPKVLGVFGRYVLGGLLVGLLWWYQAYAVVGAVLTLSMIGYSAWAVWKNKRYVLRGWYWLPVLQYVADVGVLAGSIVGAWSRLTTPPAPVKN